MKIIICSPLFKEFASPDVSLSLVMTWELGGGLFLMTSPPWRGRGGSNVLTNKYTHTHIQFCIPHISYTNSTHIPSLSPVACKNTHTHMNAYITWLCLKVSADSAFTRRHKHKQTHMNATCAAVWIMVEASQWPPHGTRTTVWATTGINHHILVLLFALSFIASVLHQ